MNSGLTDRDITTIHAIFRNFPEVCLVHLFGSRAKGNHQPGSDVDLAIMNTGVYDETVRRIKAAFDESSLPYRVDVVVYATIELDDLKAHIDRCAVEFYRRTGYA